MKDSMSPRIQAWRRAGIDCLAPTAAEMLLLILDGYDSLPVLAKMVGVSYSSAASHMRRMKGLGLVEWSYLRGDPITPTCEYVDTILDHCIPLDWNEWDEWIDKADDDTPV